MVIKSVRRLRFMYLLAFFGRDRAQQLSLAFLSL